MTISKPAIAIAIAAAMLSSACGANQRILDSSKNSSAENLNAVTSPTPAGDPVEREVKAMRNADFNFIYVFRRKDGQPLDADDKKLMAANTPPEINRRKVSEDGKAMIAGSNFHIPAAGFKALTERFDLEDFSKPESEIMANANTNANA